MQTEEKIKEQLEKVKEKSKKLSNSLSFDSIDEEDRLDTIVVVLNWVLRNDNSDLI